MENWKVENMYLPEFRKQTTFLVISLQTVRVVLYTYFVKKLLIRSSTLRSLTSQESPVLGKYNLRNYLYKEVLNLFLVYFHSFLV